MTKTTARFQYARIRPAGLPGILAAILIFGAVQQSIAAGATSGPQQPEEKRFHYLFVPNPQLTEGKRQAVRATAIIRGQSEFKLILDFRDGSWLIYQAQANLDRCTSHERLDFGGAASPPVTLVVDGAGSACPDADATLPHVSLIVGTRTSTIDGETWKSRGAAAIGEELGPELASVLAGPVAGLSQVNPFIRILCQRVVPLLLPGRETAATSALPYIARRTPDGCALDARHDEPCHDTPGLSR